MKSFSSVEGSPTQKRVVIVTLNGLGSVRSNCAPPAMRNRPALALEVVSRLRRVMTSLDTILPRFDALGQLARAPQVPWSRDIFSNCDNNLAILCWILAWR